MIRLFRFGNKNNPTFRIAVSPKHKDTHGNYIESVGHYIPKANPKIIQINAERVKYGLDHGAQPSATVHNLLVSQGVISGPKVRAFAQKRAEEEAKPEAPAAGTVAQEPAK